MQIKLWDEDIQSLTQNLAALELKINAAHRQEQKTLLQKKSAVMRYQLAIEKISQKMQAIQKRKFNLPAKSQAIIYWSATLVEKSFGLYQRQARVLGLKMWFELVHARLHGRVSQRGSMIENNDLIDMAVREGNLKKTVNFLSDQLIKAKITLDKLTERFNSVQAMQANSQAAASLQTVFGRNLSESLQNPRYVALVTYVKWLTASMRGTTDDEQRLQKLRSRINHKTETVVSACRDIILEEQGVSKFQLGDTALTRLQNNLGEIDQLQGEIERITTHMMLKTPGEPSPILMKKKFKQATREPT